MGRANGKSEARAESAGVRADAARRAAGQILAPLAHDLRSGLTGILGWTQVLERVSDDATRARSLEGIRRAVAQQTRLAEDIAEAGRAFLDEGEVEQPDAIDLAELVRAVAAELAATAKTRAVEIVLVDATPIEIYGYRRLVCQMMRLLLADALLQAPVGATLPVSIAAHGAGATIQLGALPDGGALDAAVDAAPAGRGNIRRAIAALLAQVHGGGVSALAGGAVLRATLPFRSPS